MKNVLSHIGVSAAAVFLFGVLPVQAQIAAKAEIPFSFHSNLATYESGTYTVKTLNSNATVLVLTSDETQKATFVPTGAPLDETAKTLARGPVMIFKCSQGSCFLAEVWTDSKGYSISHPRVLDEEASATHIVALVRAAR